MIFILLITKHAKPACAPTTPHLNLLDSTLQNRFVVLYITDKDTEKFNNCDIKLIAVDFIQI